MKPHILFVLFAPVLCLAQANPAPLDFAQVLQAVLELPSAEDAAVTVAKARLQWTEAARGKRIELTPQTAMWAAVNPFSIVTSLGAEALRPSGVTALTLLDAKIALVAAEIAAQQRRFERETEVAERYAALVLRETAADRQCDAVAEASRSRDGVEEQLTLARATQLDVLGWEMEIVNRKAICRQSELERQIAMIALASMMHRDGDALQLRGPRVRKAGELPLKPADALFTLAQLHRANADSGLDLRTRIRQLWENLEATRDSGMKIVLKDNGAFDAEKRLLAEKLHQLEAQAEEMEQRLQARIAEIRVRIDSLEDQAEYARERVLLTQRQREASAIRLSAGLASHSDVRTMDAAVRQANLTVAALTDERNASVAALVSVCGLDGQPAELQAQIYERSIVQAAVR